MKTYSIRPLELPARLEASVAPHLLEELGTVAARQAILDAFDEGASVLSYMGHGGIHPWADENLFDRSSVDSEPLLLLTMNCLNGYFDFPFFDSLSEELVAAEGAGDRQCRPPT